MPSDGGGYRVDFLLLNARVVVEIENLPGPTVPVAGLNSNHRVSNPPGETCPGFSYSGPWSPGDPFQPKGFHACGGRRYNAQPPLTHRGSPFSSPPPPRANLPGLTVLPDPSTQPVLSRAEGNPALWRVGGWVLTLATSRELKLFFPTPKALRDLTIQEWGASPVIFRQQSPAVFFGRWRPGPLLWAPGGRECVWTPIHNPNPRSYLDPPACDGLPPLPQRAAAVRGRAAEAPTAARGWVPRPPWGAAGHPSPDPGVVLATRFRGKEGFHTAAIRGEGGKGHILICLGGGESAKGLLGLFRGDFFLKKPQNSEILHQI